MIQSILIFLKGMSVILKPLLDSQDSQFINFNVLVNCTMIILHSIAAFVQIIAMSAIKSLRQEYTQSFVQNVKIISIWQPEMLLATAPFSKLQEYAQTSQL
jgi:lysophospholipid acyltransferase (LPLAT)-like uncharacterized protein